MSRTTYRFIYFIVDYKIKNTPLYKSKSSNLFLSSETSAPNKRSRESNDSPPTRDADWGAIWPLSAASNNRCSGCGRAMPGPASDMDLAVVARMRTWETCRAEAVASASAAAR